MASQAGETPNGTYKPRYVDVGHHNAISKLPACGSRCIIS